MNSVQFPEANFSYRSKDKSDKKGPSYEELPICRTKDSEGFPIEISCYEFTADEMVQAIISGRLYLGVCCSPMPPVFVSVFNPMESMEDHQRNIESNRTIGGAIDILIERAEQLDKHGYTIEHDSQYIHGELKDAALFCQTLSYGFWPNKWSTDLMDKIARKPEEERLAIAGAFLAAHIDWINNQKRIHESEN